MDKIKEAIKEEIKREKRDVASAALTRMNFILLNMRVNSQLKKPYSMETIANWLEREMEEFKKNFTV